ncbi:MAG: hypothetical protein HGN29_14040 [Asgard group archaeon]|nr:hypothetical protein [Asgard group archaeon]
MTGDNVNGESEVELGEVLKKESNFEWILDELPFGISVQKADRTIIYENQKVREMVGSFLYRQCYNRWHYIPERKNEPCPDCPANIGFSDKQRHNIFRKTISENGDNLFLEIQFIPVLDENEELEKYIEIIRDVKLTDKTRILSSKSSDEILESVQISFVKYGYLGGEVITTDQLDFAKKDHLNELITKVTVYIFSGVMQGFENQMGLFGPFPVLDKTDFLMETFVFQLKDDQADYRFGGKQPCLLLVFFPREYYFLFENRSEIEEFVIKKINSWENMKSINIETHENFKNQFFELLKTQL